ncbi:acyl-CoA thioesterase [Nostoc sp.]|uniref:acyl-CoA thioesterase n=1 Tax=Nostoc sp. TaxID=1180 RepID=UPI002FFB5DF4
MIFPQLSIFPLTVQFEDVDAHGVVHHPNYLKYLERARSYGLRKCGYSLEKLISSGSVLAISEIQANFLRPALLEEELFVISQVIDIGKTTIKVQQAITLHLPQNDELNIAEDKHLSLPETIFMAKIRLVCVDFKSTKAKSIPQDLKQAIKSFNQPLVTNSPQNIDI